MNRRDSSGFRLSPEDLELNLEILRTERCTLLGFPSRDLREWVIRDSAGKDIGWVDQEGNSRFWLPNGDAISTVAYARLEDAVRAVEFAEFIRSVCGITSGFLQ